MTATKKCPECYSHIAIDAKECDVCKTKVGKRGKGEIADRPVNWKAYVECFLIWILLAVFLWWSFFKNQ